MSSEYRLLNQFSYVKFSSINQDANLVLLGDPSRLRSQITSVLCPKTLVLCTSFVYRVYHTRAVFAWRILRTAPVPELSPSVTRAHALRQVGKPGDSGLMRGWLAHVADGGRWCG